MSTTTHEEQTADTNVEVDTGVRRRVLENRVMLLSPRVGSWEGRYKIPVEIVEMKIAGKDIDAAEAKKKGVTTPQTVMMNDNWPTDADGTPWKKRFAKVSSLKERILRKYSIPFSAAGARIVPMANAQQFFHELIGLTLGKLRDDLKRYEEADQQENAEVVRRRIAEECEKNPLITDSTPLLDPTREEQSFAYKWWAVANEFCQNLDDVFEQIKDNIEPREAWNAVQGRVPTTPELMRAKFYCDVLPVELAGGGQGQTERVTADVLAAYDGVVRDACNRAVEAAIETVVERPREELAAAIANLQELIGNNGRVSTKSFRPVYEAMEKLQGFRFAASDTIMEAIDQLQGRMDRTTPSTLDSVTAANNGFTAALRGVMQEIEDADAASRDIEEFGREHRGFSFD